MNIEASFMATQPQRNFVSGFDTAAHANLSAGLLLLDRFITGGNGDALQAAAHHFTQALAADERNAQAYRCLAFIYSTFQQYDTAINYVVVAAALEPNAPGLNCLKRLVYTARLSEPDAPASKYPFD